MAIVSCTKKEEKPTVKKEVVTSSENNGAGRAMTCYGFYDDGDDCDARTGICCLRAITVTAIVKEDLDNSILNNTVSDYFRNYKSFYRNGGLDTAILNDLVSGYRNLGHLKTSNNNYFYGIYLTGESIENSEHVLYLLQ